MFDHAPDLDNLISVAKSLMDIFWPFASLNPLPAEEHLQGLVEKHGIKEDFGAFCYTFSVLLSLGSYEDTVERKEELGGVTSGILKIFSLGRHMEFVANPPTRTTYKQLYWQDFDQLVGVVVDASFVQKLKDFRDSVARDYNFPND